jgi:hypothetical protein
MLNQKVIDTIKGMDATALVAELERLRYDLVEQAQKNEEMAATARAKAHEITEVLEQLGGSDGGTSISSGRQVPALRGEEPTSQSEHGSRG